MTDLRHENHGNDLGFERQDLGSRPIVGFIVSLVVMGVLTYYVLWGMFHFLDAYDRKHQRAVSPMVQVEPDTRTVTPAKIQQFPEPRLEDNERTELNDFRYQEEEKLNSYGWVDQNAGVVHIPITRAMELVAQRGLPTTPQAGTMPLSPVNLAKAAAATSDTSGMPSTPANPQPQQKGKRQ
jgi:hypothetical protein